MKLIYIKNRQHANHVVRVVDELPNSKNSTQQAITLR